MSTFMRRIILISELYHCQCAACTQILGNRNELITFKNIMITIKAKSYMLFNILCY